MIAHVKQVKAYQILFQIAKIFKYVKDSTVVK